ncbi:MAG: SxtJ family membrane protein [Ferruginibacter sp.]
MKLTQAQKTILVIAAGLLVFYFMYKKDWLWISAAVILVTGFISSFLAEKIHWAWMKVAHILGAINGFILLNLIFFFLLTPIALIRKILKKTPLQLQKSKTGTMFFTRNHTYQKKDAENVW